MSTFALRFFLGPNGEFCVRNEALLVFTGGRRAWRHQFPVAFSNNHIVGFVKLAWPRKRGSHHELDRILPRKVQVVVEQL